MFKLNDKGWGVVTFVILISLLFFAILLVAHLVNKIGGSFPLSVKAEKTYCYVDILEK